MSENTTTDLTFKVQDYGQTTQVAPQYGMRYPDGTITWVSAATPNHERVDFKKLADGDATTAARWNTAVQQRAEKAMISHIEYAAGHQLVKRTVIVAVTEIEEA